MVVEIISGIEKIGHSIYDWQIRSGIFKARCNIEEAINLGTETSMLLSKVCCLDLDAGEALH